jgi:competence protein ComEA
VSELTPQRVLTFAAIALAILLIGWRYQHQSSAGQQPPASFAAPAETAPPASPVVVVDVTGAVRRPGVYRLRTGARVQDAVRRAGVARSADLSGINLAALLADGEQIVVPKSGDAVASSAAGNGPADAIVHLNSATEAELESLDGIGPALAQRIIDYRQAHGGFRNVEELDQVSGFGPARLAALEGRVAL